MKLRTLSFAIFAAGFLLSSCANMKYKTLERDWENGYYTRWDCEKFLEKYPDDVHAPRVQEELDWILLKKYKSDSLTAFNSKYPNSTHREAVNELLAKNASKELKELNKYPQSKPISRFENFVRNHPDRAKDDSLLIPWEISASKYYNRSSYKDDWQKKSGSLTEAIRRLDYYIEQFPDGPNRKKVDSIRAGILKWKITWEKADEKKSPFYYKEIKKECPNGSLFYAYYLDSIPNRIKSLDDHFYTTEVKDSEGTSMFKKYMDLYPEGKHFTAVKAERQKRINEPIDKEVDEIFKRSNDVRTELLHWVGAEPGQTDVILEIDTKIYSHNLIVRVSGPTSKKYDPKRVWLDDVTVEPGEYRIAIVAEDFLNSPFHRISDRPLLGKQTLRPGTYVLEVVAK